MRIFNDSETQSSTGMEEIFISLVEVKKENWSFVNGVAEFAK